MYLMVDCYIYIFWALINKPQASNKQDGRLFYLSKGVLEVLMNFFIKFEERESKRTRLQGK